MDNTLVRAIIALLVLSAFATCSASAAGDPANGKTLFARCGIGAVICGWPLRCKSEVGLMLRSDGCGHLFGLFARHYWPLALMESASQVPLSLSSTKL